MSTPDSVISDCRTTGPWVHVLPFQIFQPMIIDAERFLVGGGPVGHVLTCHHSFASAPGGVHHAGIAQIGVDRLGHKALVECIVGGFDLRFASLDGFGLRQDPVPGISQRRVGEQGRPALVRCRPAARLRRTSAIRL